MPYVCIKIEEPNRICNAEWKETHKEKSANETECLKTQAHRAKELDNECKRRWPQQIDTNHWKKPTTITHSKICLLFFPSSSSSSFPLFFFLFFVFITHINLHTRRLISTWAFQLRFSFRFISVRFDFGAGQRADIFLLLTKKSYKALFTRTHPVHAAANEAATDRS